MDKFNKKNISMPKYQQIAMDIATKIAREEYIEGEKIYGRSSIASQYSVSPETARKAFCILTDYDIVTPERGSGMIIKSHKNALEFLSKFVKKKTIETIQSTLMQSIDRQKKEIDTLNECLSEIVSTTEYFKSINPLIPFSVRVTDKCKYINKTIEEMRFWQNTGATLLAIKRDGNLMRSPGPYAKIKENDIIYFILQEDNDQNVRDFLF